MNTRQFTTTLAHSAMLAVGIGFGAWLLAAPPAGAHQYSTDAFGTGKDETAAQMRMPGGVLSALKVKLTTTTAPSSGTFTLSVRINGLNTLLTCQLATTGNCTANANVPVANNARLAVRVSNDFTGSGLMAYTYTLLFN